MIVETLKTQRKLPAYPIIYQSPTYYKEDGDFVGDQLSQTGYLFRTNVINSCLKSAGYNVGDIVRPSSEELFKKEGFYKVQGMCRTWYEYKGSIKKDKDVPWPKENNPKIVMAIQLSTGQIFECTTNYLVALNDKEKAQYEAIKS